MIAVMVALEDFQRSYREWVEPETWCTATEEWVRLNCL